MRQILFTIPHELGPLPIFGFGWLLLVWGVLSIALMIWLVRRQGWNADTRGYLPVLLVFGAVIAFVAPLLEKKGLDGQPLGLQIPGFGVMLLAGIVSGVYLAARQARRSGIDPEVVYSVSFWMVVAGILGARTFYIVEYWPQFQRETLAATLVEVINFTKGGIVVYGALIGGLGAALLFVRLRKLPALTLGDVLAPGMLLGLAVGRIGCLMNGCCYGGVCELSAAPKLRFPAASPAYIHQERLGQMHGIRVGEDAGGRVTIERVESDKSVGGTSLQVGDIVKSIQLPVRRSLEAAQRVPEFAGAELAVVTVDGRTARVAIRPAPLAARHLLQNEIGFRVHSQAAAMPEIAEVAPGGAAERAGLKVGDKLRSIRLPPLPNVEAARNVLQTAGSRLTIETEDGRTESWSADALPDRSLPVHPTQIYSSINAALLCLLLWAWHPFRRQEGEVLALMLTLYPITRILLEMVRDDEPAALGTPLTISQIVSLMVLLAAAVLWVHLLRRPCRSGPAMRQAA